MQSIRQWMGRPYPFITSWQLQISTIFLVSAGALVTLMAFKPFGLHVTDNMFIAGFAGNAFISLCLHFLLVPTLFPKIANDEGWTIRHQVLFICSILLVISVLNYAYNVTLGKNYSPQYSLPYFVYMTTAVGLLPVMILTYISEKIARKQHEKEAVKINKEIIKERLSPTTATVKITGENHNESKVFPVSTVVAIKAEGNYVTLTYIEENSSEKWMIRQSMKSILSQLENHPQFIRCHKSYIINRDLIESAEGNARSLQLRMAHLEDSIPVSRTFDRTRLELQSY